jgi:hypothetical protein
MFFFEKKNQKTFMNLRGGRMIQRTQIHKSLFASFFSEREDSSFPKRRNLNDA